MRIERPAQGPANERDYRHLKAVSTSQFQYVDVIFAAAGVDTVIPHTLTPNNLEHINYELVDTGQACHVYRDTSVTRRAWGADYIVLRSDVTNARVRLRLSVEQAAFTNQREGQLGDGTSAPPADPMPFPIQEGGTWTPGLLGTGGQSGQAYAAQHGYYVKSGKLVTAGFRVQLSTLGTITGTVRIGGLPFTSLNQTNYRASGALNWTNMTATFTTVFATLVPNVTVMEVLGAKAAQVSGVLLVQGDLSNTTVLAGSITYIAEA